MRRLLAFVSLIALTAPAMAADRTLDLLVLPATTENPGTKSIPEPITATSAPAPVTVVAPAAVSSPVIVPVSTPSAMPAAAPVRPLQKGNLRDILAHAYTDSPILRAEREVLRQQYENVTQADSFKRPTLNAQGATTWTRSDMDPGDNDDYNGYDASVTLKQYLYRGGRTLAEVEQQLRLSDAAIAAYDTITQDTFLKVITAAMDIQRDRRTIDLNEQNRTVILRQSERVGRQFEVGELTRTDVAQSQARLSDADADLVDAKADYESALARYRQYAGVDGSDLEIADVAVTIPPTLEAAKSLAEIEHPQIRAALESEKASKEAIRLASGELLPELYVAGAAGTAKNPVIGIDTDTSASIALRASMPLYEAGEVRSRVRQAKYGQFEQEERVTEAKRDVRRQVETAWNDYQAARAQITAREKQVSAARLARDGVYKEREVGTRTVIDTLDADAELLDAEVSLVQAQRDQTVAGYMLVAATGQLTAEKLGLASANSEKSYLDAARGNWFGTGARPRD
jgi:TolC family type I secretion outer membrane protein